MKHRIQLREVVGQGDSQVAIQWDSEAPAVIRLASGPLRLDIQVAVWSEVEDTVAEILAERERLSGAAKSEAIADPAFAGLLSDAIVTRGR